MNIILFICFLTSLMPCCFSYRKLKECHKEANLFLFTASAVYSLIFLYGIIVRLYLGDESNTATIQRMYAVASKAGCSLSLLQYLIYIASAVISAVNVILAMIISKSPRPASHCLLFVVVFLVLLSCVASVFFGTSPFVNFFMSCCGIMAYFAFVLELTYREFCVLGNIYVQASVCLFSALAPVMLLLRKNNVRELGIRKMLIPVNAALHGIVFIAICAHYWMPLDPAFDLCYHELMQLASFTGLSYIMVNIVIFVILFVSDLAFNAVLYKVV